MKKCEEYHLPYTSARAKSKHPAPGVPVARMPGPVARMT
jgi:hypothetical protein